jgi:hypothetical protein
VNAKTRQARQIVRQRSADTRFNASLNRGRALATHAIAAGVAQEDVKGFANGLRSKAKDIGEKPVKVTRARNTVDGKGGRKAKLKIVFHFTAAQVQRINAAYKPRKAAFKAAKLALAA